MRKLSFKLFLSAIALLGTAVLTSCDSEQLSKRLAKNAIEEHPAFRDSSVVVNLSTGYYEVDADKLLQLQQLEKAKMITLKSETVIEKRRKWVGGYFYGHYTDVNVEHTFATVELTEEGRKYEVTNVPKLREDWEKVMKKLEKKYNDMALPEYMDLTAKVDNEKKEAEAVDEVAADSVMVEEDFVEEPEPQVNTSVQSSYDAACAKVNAVDHKMLVGKFKVVEVLDVFCPEEYKKNGRGECSAVYELTDKTPFGWVLYHGSAYEKLDVKLMHTEDNGWIVTSLD